MADSKQLPNEGSRRERQTEEIVAYLDGELEPNDAEGLAAKLASTRSCAPRRSLCSGRGTFSTSFRDRSRRRRSRREPSRRRFRFRRCIRPDALIFATGSRVDHDAPPPRPGIVFWLVSMAVVLLAGGLGYVGHLEQPRSRRSRNRAWKMRRSCGTCGSIGMWKTWIT